MNNKFTKKQEQQICSEYLSKEKPSTITLAKEWNCNSETIRNILKRNECILRTRSEALKGKFSGEKNPMFGRIGNKNPMFGKTGKKHPFYKQHHSEETKRKLKVFIKEEEQQICSEYLSKEKPSFNTLAKRWNCSSSTIRDIIMRNGYVLRTLKETRSTPEAIRQILKNGFGTNCYYNNEFFPSLLERDCYIKLKKLGFKVKHNFLNRFDFLINNKVVVEFHPFDFKLTDKQYYTQRRKLLDEYGHKDLKLIVIKDLKVLERVIK